VLNYFGVFGLVQCLFARGRTKYTGTHARAAVVGGGVGRAPKARGEVWLVVFWHCGSINAVSLL